MSVTPDQPAPYAPASVIVDLIERHRNKGLPSPVTSDVLARAGVSDSLIARSLQALQALDLIDADGKPTETLEGIRLAPEAEYTTRLQQWLAAAYADALLFIDPATATETDIRDAFRNYRPVGQQNRMVTLFIGLFRAAGVTPVKGSAPAKKKSPAPATKPGGGKAKAGGGKSPPANPGGGGGADFGGSLPPAIAGLLTSLPLGGEGWTKAQREAFMTTLGVVIDFCFPPGVVKAPKNTVEGDDAPDT